MPSVPPDRPGRESLPTTMPRSVTPRLEWLDRLEWVVAVDAATTYTELRADGWPAEAAADTAAGSAEWLGAKLARAVALGVGLAQVLDVEEEAV